MQVEPKAFYVALVAPFLVWSACHAGTSAWIHRVDADRGPTVTESLLMPGGMWVIRHSAFIVIIAFAAIPLATFLGSRVVRPPKHAWSWLTVLVASLVFVVAAAATDAFLVAIPLIASTAAAQGIVMAAVCRMHRELVAQGHGGIPVSWLLLVVLGLHSIYAVLGTLALVVALLWGRRARVSGGAVQQADAADEARRSCR